MTDYEAQIMALTGRKPDPKRPEFDAIHQALGYPAEQRAPTPGGFAQDQKWEPAPQPSSAGQFLADAGNALRQSPAGMALRGDWQGAGQGMLDQVAKNVEPTPENALGFLGVTKAVKGLDMSDAARLSRAADLGHQRGLWRGGADEILGPIDVKRMGGHSGAKDAKGNMWFFVDPKGGKNALDAAQEYADEAARRKGRPGTGVVQEFSTNSKNIKTIDRKGLPYNPRDYEEIVDIAKAEGYQGVLLKNADDSLFTNRVADTMSIWDLPTVRDFKRAGYDKRKAKVANTLASAGAGLGIAGAIERQNDE